MHIACNTLYQPCNYYSMTKYKEEDWYVIEDIEDLDSPALIVYKDRVNDNIKLAIEVIGDVDRLRPHIKTHKVREIVRMCINEGIKKFKCATIAEADILGMTGAKDVLLAYQPVGPKVSRFIEVIKDYTQTKFSCLVDNENSAAALATLAKKNYLQIQLYVDVNIGMNRTGIAPEKAANLFQYCHSLEGVIPVGLHAYDGHLHMPNLTVRTRAATEAINSVIAVKMELQKKGFKNLSLIAGGSPTFPIHASNSEIECSPGTFVYWDAGYSEAFTDQKFKPASVVVSRVVSIPGKNKICIDLGHKSIAAENILSNRVRFINAPELIPVSQSEEHMVLDAPDGNSYQPGMVLYGIPYHICPTSALYERAVVIRNRRISEEWMVLGRDRRIRN